MARTLLNAADSGFLANDYLEVNPLGIIDQDKASESHEATVRSKGTLNSTFDTTDHDFHIMEGFGARDVRHEDRVSDDRLVKLASTSSTSTDDSAAVDTARVSISQAGSEQDTSGIAQTETAVNAEGTNGLQAAAQSAVSTSTLSTAVATDATSAVSADAAGFPDATNTGVKAGVALTKYNGTLHITQDNAVISNMDVTGDIVIDAKNVTLSNVKLTSTGASAALRVMDDATGFTLKDSEINGRGLSDNGVYGHGTFLRNDIQGVENAFNLSGPAVIRDNYLHSLLGGSDAHYDTIEINGGHDIDIIHNTVINDHDQTAAVMMNNEFGGLSNITIDGNRLVGGGYTVYLDGRKGGGAVDDSSIKITNNQIGGGHWGDFSLYDSKPVLSGNTDLDTLPTVPTVYTGTAGDDILPVSGMANAGSETFKGLAGDDLLKGGAGADVLEGGAGSDTASYAGSSAAVKVSLLAGTATGGHATGDKLSSIENLLGSSYADTLTGNSSNNILKGGAGADKLDGGTGADTVSYWGASAGVTASLANTSINTGDARGDAYVSIERLTGTSHADKLTGNGGTNLLIGGSGNDVLNGGSGNDTIYGGGGADDLTGGAGADTFVFKARADTTVSTTGRDTIFDFSGTGGDRIDLSDIDANASASGNQAFTYLGTAAFTGKAGELRTVKQASDTYVYGDTNGDKTADFAVHLDDAISLSKGYFVL